MQNSNKNHLASLKAATFSWFWYWFWLVASCCLSKGDTSWKTEPRSTAALPCILTLIVFNPIFYMKFIGVGRGGCQGDHGASWDQAYHWPSGPLRSGGLSVNAGNLPLKLCKLSGVSPSPELSPSTTYSQLLPGSTPLPLFIPPMCSSPSVPPFPLVVLPLPLWKSTVHRPQKLSPYPPLSLSQAMQSKNWTWPKKKKKKEGGDTERA